MGARLRARAQFVRLVVLAAVGLGAYAAPAAPAAAVPAMPEMAHVALLSSVATASRHPGPHRPRLAGGAAPGAPWLAEPPPEVRMVAPAGSRATLDSVVRLEFSEPMDLASVQRSFHVQPAVDGAVEWPDPRTMIFRPSELAAGTTYQVSVAGLSEARPRLAAIGSFAFTTVYPPPRVPFPFMLTFDDCASADAIRAIMTALADRGLRATFFPTGVCRDLFPWLVPGLLAAGHRVCNHTYSHPDLTKLSDGAVRAQIQGGVAAECDLFRPPYGAIDRGGRIAGIAASLGYRIQLWDVDTRDWAGTSAAAMVAMIRARGGVVLMHLHGAHTVEAIRTL